MSIGKKFAVIFLALVNVISIAAGVFTQLKLIAGSDVTSIIPITVSMSVDKILLVNFLAVVIVIMLISIATTAICVDVGYTPVEIFSNCPIIFMVLPILIFLVGIYNAINAPDISDKIFIIVSGLVYLLASAVNVGCIFTIIED